MAFAFDEDHVTVGRRFAAEESGQAAHRHLLGRGHAGGFEESRGEVAEVDERVDLQSGLGLLAPADRQRHAGALVVAVAQAARHLPAIVGAIDDERVFEFAGG
ncbi:MAG: hypothetical protein EBX95_15180 [Acidimicrobiia bacterium]|nr:hypothetical protein [Acidimicrobiia bacterium]